MGRHATASSRSQKWQVAGNRNSEATSEVRVERPSEEKVAGGSTPTSSPSCAALISKSEDRERWADIAVESDGEQVVEFDGKHYGDDAYDPKGEGWSVSGKRAGRMRPKTRAERAAKADPPAPPVVARTTRDAIASSRQTTAKQAEVAPAPVPYRPPKSDSRKTQQDHYESSNAHHWEASSWGTSGSGWKSSSKTHGSTWESGTWDQKQDAHRSSDSRKHRGKEKNESFKRGPMVATNMDASRLAW